jgi:hypothetical protein
MNPQERKAAIVAYKERKAVWGVYAVICNATGEAWVGASRHVDTQRNGLFFTLRLGSSPHVSLQTAWGLHGEAEFRFEELERLSDSVPEFARVAELERRRKLWRVRLEAADL